jgi:hypothetical protein
MSKSTKVLICIWLLIAIAVGFRTIQKSQPDYIQQSERVK